MTKTVTIESAPPRTAIEAVAFAKEKCAINPTDLSLHTTDGLQNNTKAIWKAINALAMFVDGVALPVTHQIEVPDHYEVDKATGELRPVAPADPKALAVAA